MKLTEIEVRGKKFEVNVDEHGRFGTDCGGWISAVSLEELREKLTRLTRNTKVAIPFIIWTEQGMRRGVCTGEHASNRNLLVKFDDNARNEQMSSWNLSDAVDPNFEKQYLDVCLAFESAKKAKEDFEERVGLEIGKLVAEAIAKAEKAGA